jgi:hypothetical protein
MDQDQICNLCKQTHALICIHNTKKICKLCEYTFSTKCKHESLVVICINKLFELNEQRNKAFGKQKRNKRKKINMKCQDILNYLDEKLSCDDFEYLLNMFY